MNPDRLKALLRDVSAGTLSADAALDQLRSLPFDDLGFAKVDHHRQLRTGLPEVIFGSGKTAEQIIAIARRVRDNAQNVLITRLAHPGGGEVKEAFPPRSSSPDARRAEITHPEPKMTGRG